MAIEEHSYFYLPISVWILMFTLSNFSAGQSTYDQDVMSEIRNQMQTRMDAEIVVFNRNRVRIVRQRIVNKN